MEFISGKMAIGMKAHGTTALSMEKDLIFLPMETCTLENMFKANQRGKESTSGRMEAFIMENSKME